MERFVDAFRKIRGQYRETVVCELPASAEAGWMRGSKRSREATKVRADGAVLVKKSHPGCGVKDPVEILFRFSNVFADDERQVEALRIRVQHHWHHGRRYRLGCSRCADGVGSRRPRFVIMG